MGTSLASLDPAISSNSRLRTTPCISLVDLATSAPPHVSPMHDADAYRPWHALWRDSRAMVWHPMISENTDVSHTRRLLIQRPRSSVSTTLSRYPYATEPI